MTHRKNCAFSGVNRTPIPEYGAHFLPAGGEEQALVNPRMWQAISFEFKQADLAQERLTGRKIRTIIRFKYAAGLPDRVIAGACKVSGSTVGQYLQLTNAAGLSWPLPELGEDELL